MAITEHTINDALTEVLSGTGSLRRAKGACQAITPNNSDNRAIILSHSTDAFDSGPYKEAHCISVFLSQRKVTLGTVPELLV